MPVRPAMHTGTQPPLGVTEIAQPLSSAAWIEVVPLQNMFWASLCSARSELAGVYAGAAWFVTAPEDTRRTYRSTQFVRCERKGLTSPWNGYGSPGPTAAEFRSQVINFKRSR